MNLAGWFRLRDTPPPRRVRLYQNGHGVYLADRLIRSNAYPEAHWGQGLGLSNISRPPRVPRTLEQTKAFMAYVHAQHLGYDMFH